MGTDFLGQRIDEVIETIVLFVFQTLPYLMIALSLVYFFYKLLKPVLIITY